MNVFDLLGWSVFIIMLPVVIFSVIILLMMMYSFYRGVLK
jgi:hypothetical protein